MMMMVKNFLILLLLFSFGISNELQAHDDAVLRGVVRDLFTFRPIQGAEIDLIRGFQIRYSDTTNDNGRYLLTDLRPNEYIVVVKASGYRTRLLGVELDNHEITTLNVFLIPNAGAIVGTITDAVTTNPIPGANIRLFQGTTFIAITTADAAGNYSFPDLARGSYNLVASADGYNTAAKGANVAIGSTATVDFALEKIPGTISGTVTDAVTTNPIEGATVIVFSGPVVMAATDTDAGGNYTIPDLPPGSYTVLVNADNYRIKSEGATVTSGNTTIVNFALNSNPGTIVGTVTNVLTGTPIEGATIQVFQGATLIGSAVLTDPSGNYRVENLAPGTYVVRASSSDFQAQIQGANVTANTTTTVDFALQSDPGEISGTVTDAITTAPIAGAILEVFQGTVVIGSALTDDSGNYTVAGLPSGDYIVRATAANYQGKVVGAFVTSGGTTIVNFALDQNPGTISGIVTDAVTTNPIAGATVSVYSGQILIGAGLTDVNGSYSILGLAAGNYTIVCSATGYQSKAQGAAVVSGSTTVVDFALDLNPGAIVGTVTRSDTGGPIPGATIAIFQQFTFIGSTLTDINGTYSFQGLSPGEYTVIAHASNFQSQATGAIVIANASTTANLVLAPNPGTITGKVIDAITTDPISGALIHVHGPVEVAIALTDANGNYSIPGLEPGNYSVTIIASGYQSKTVSVAVTANNTTTVNFALNPFPGTITGTVTDAMTTNPIPGATVAIFQGTNLIAATLTDTNGNFSIPGLSPGHYTVLARATGYQTAFEIAIVNANATTIVNFALNGNPGTIAGTITDQCTGSGVPGVLVIVFDGSSIVSIEVTDENGQYFITDLAPSNYTVVIAKRNYVATSEPATVTAGNTTIVNIVFTPIPLPPASISGTASYIKFLTQKTRTHCISWTASPSGCITGYQVFRNGVLVQMVPPSGPFSYCDQNRNNMVDTYSVRAVNQFGQVSEFATVVLN